MHTFTYAAELDPLLEVSLPADWIAAVVLEPGQLLSESENPEDQLLEQLFRDDNEEVVATRLQFLYFRGIDSDRRTLFRDSQISVSYDVETGQYELSSRETEKTVQIIAVAASWIDEQFIAVETATDTYRVLIDLADDIHGLGRTGVQELVDTFETLDAIQTADVGALAAVPYVDEENATALQTGLEDADAVGGDDPTELELVLQTRDGPLILDFAEGLIPGKLIPSDGSEPKYVSEGLGGADPQRDSEVERDG
jgi:hypothetical protein